jgi:hypothetical protein
VQQVVVPAVLVLASLLLIVAAVALVRPQLVEARSGTTDPAPAPTADLAPASSGDPVSPPTVDPVSPPAVDPTSPPAATEDGHRPARTSGSPSVLTPKLPDGDDVEQRSTEATATTVPEQGPPEDELSDILQVLLDGRGEAWERADDVLLLGIVAPDSPAETSETEQLARLRESGVRYPDVTFRVEDATLVPDGTPARAADVDAGPDAGTDRIAVRATVSRAALEGRDGGGGRLDPLPTSSERVRIELARLDERWLLWSWEPAPTG